ncbi:hypothetical protein E2C01_034963 [Portunus trituberculatus]|uniref:Uncharacterized protein n=1 Tax=Portunus trituberculatus TaxID=210409 RepID=A0A5B7FA72_PORTR|nr:hypothetical protein [Portunus trituberculatus]
MSYISDILKHGEAANLSSAEIGRLVQLATEREDRAFAEKERADCEERVKERAHELALAEGQKPALVSGTSRPLEEATRPRVPPFTDGDSYLARFGKVAQFHHWRDEDLALHLGSLLKVRDQFLNSCTPDVQVFPKKKGSISNADLAKAADVYRAAHGTKCKTGTPLHCVRLFGTSSVIPYGGSSTEVQILLWIGSCR